MKELKQQSDIAISVENVSKTFTIPHERINTLKGAFVNIFKRKYNEKFNALEDISFEVKKGEFFGILGRNGSGKSTLLKILAGVYVANRGKIKINGLISPFLELGIGFNPELSGRDNIYLNGTVLGLTEKQINEKFDSIVAFSELERFIDQKIKNYSSGMQVRLAFSVAIHANREILLMDEVLAVGDTNFQSKCLTEFSRYKEMGKTVILVTHDIGTVQRYCDRAMLLRNGKIEMIGNPEEVGNEYIYQNMSDEEKRTVDEQKRIKKEQTVSIQSNDDDKGEKTNKIAEITKVEFLDKDGKEKNVFETGEDMSIRVHFKQNKKVPVLNFGLAIFNIENNYISGINTIIDQINTGQYCGQSFFEVKYKNIPIRTNSYYVKAGIWRERTDKLVDFLNKSDIFKIYSKDKNDGILNLNYEWK